MTLLEPGTRPADEQAQPVPEGRTPGVLLACWIALLRGGAAAFGALVLVGGLSVLLWALTAVSGAGIGAVLRSAALAFAAAHTIPIPIGTAELTLPPMMLSLVALGALAASMRRTRFAPVGRAAEAAALVTGALAYGAVCTVVAVAAGAGRVPISVWWRPTLLAAAVLSVLTACRGAWSHWLRGRVAGWLLVGVRAGAAGGIAVVAGGALVLAGSLAMSFRTAVQITRTVADGFGDGLGITALQLGYLPNAAVSGAGFASGAGFSIGAGHYSIFGSVRTELPAIPMLAAVPEHPTASGWMLLTLLVPVLAGVIAGRAVCSRLTGWRDRAAGMLAAAVVAGLGCALLAQLASGGVTPGPYPVVGVAPLLFGLLISGELTAVGGVVLLVSQPIRVPWRPRAVAEGADSEEAGPAAQAPEQQEAGAEEPTGGAEAGQVGRAAEGTPESGPGDSAGCASDDVDEDVNEGESASSQSAEGASGGDVSVGSSASGEPETVDPDAEPFIDPDEPEAGGLTSAEGHAGPRRVKRAGDRRHGNRSAGRATRP